MKTSIYLSVLLSTFALYSNDCLAENAVSTIREAKTGKVLGSMTLKKNDKKVDVSLNLKGLTSNTTHGFHVHEFGDCSSDDFKSAGGHFNPSAEDHGSPTGEAHHAGDLGNVTTDANGNVNLDKSFSNFGLSGEKSVVGRAVILHQDADDFKSQPSGNAGARIGCGVIGIAE